MSREDTVDALIGRWTRYGLEQEDEANPGQKYKAPRVYGFLAKCLYQVRNPGKAKVGYLKLHSGTSVNPAVSWWPTHLVDDDPEIMAAIEHYFLVRFWIGNAVYSAFQTKIMIGTYMGGKSLFPDLMRHNPDNPVTPVSDLQKTFQAKGITHGESDLKIHGGEPPLLAEPPVY